MGPVFPYLFKSFQSLGLEVRFSFSMRLA